MLSGIAPDHEFESRVDWQTQIGRGTTRHVYGVLGDEALVIKRSIGPFYQGNHVEWIVWNAIERMAGSDLPMGETQNEKLQHLFARCTAISFSGRYLMMERLHSGGIKHDFYASLPGWLNDKKPSAVGISADGLPKVMDYAHVNFYSVLNPMNNTCIFG